MGVSDFNPEAGGPGYLYLKLADFIAACIESEELKPGSRLPGERDFAEQYGVSIGTARRATEELRERGLVTTLPAKGNFITSIRSSPRSGPPDAAFRARSPTGREPGRRADSGRETP